MERLENKDKRQRISYAFTPIHQLIRQLKLAFSQCLICHAQSKVHPQLCSHCINNLPMFQLEKVNDDLLNWPAVEKLFSKRYFDHLVSVTPYCWPLSEWINQLKYHRRHDYASVLSYLLQIQWQNRKSNELPVDLIACVPVHTKKWQSRGFNQVHILTQPLADNLAISYLDDLIIRVVHKKAQVEQTGAQRRKILKHNFELSKPERASGKHVLLIDDVMTTGATVNEISRLLKAADVKKITVLTLCISLDKA